MGDSYPAGLDPSRPLETSDKEPSFFTASRTGSSRSPAWSSGRAPGAVVMGAVTGAAVALPLLLGPGRCSYLLGGLSNPCVPLQRKEAQVPAPSALLVRLSEAGSGHS